MNRLINLFKRLFAEREKVAIIVDGAVREIDLDRFIAIVKKTFDESVSKRVLEGAIEPSSTLINMTVKNVYHNFDSIEQGVAKYAVETIALKSKKDDSTLSKLQETILAYGLYHDTPENETAKRGVLLGALTAWSLGNETPKDYLRIFRGIR